MFFAGGKYSVSLSTGQIISAKISGRMRKYQISVIIGDRVTVGLSPYDVSHGLIISMKKLAQKPNNFIISKFLFYFICKKNDKL